MPRRILILLLALSTALAAAWLCCTGPSISGVTIIGKNNRVVPITLPFLKAIAPRRVLHFSGHINRSIPATTFVRIIPDDCAVRLELNGREVPLENLTEGNVCDWERGFLIDLREYLHDGENTFQISIDNHKGRAALRMLAENRKLLESAPGLFFAVTAILLLYLGARHLALSPGLSLLLVLGMGLRLIYLSETGPYDRTYDVYVPTGHYDYIRYVRTAFALPPASGGWQYHQAPLYYLLAAGFQVLTGTTGALTELFGLQLLSVLFSLGFIIYAVRTYNLVFADRNATLLASALTIFWPSAVIHSVRIGNDGLLYFFSAAALYHSIVWYRYERCRDLLWTSIAVSLAVLTKSNGAVLVLYLWILVALKRSREKAPSRNFVRTGAAAFAVSLIALVAEAGPKIWAFARGKSAHWLVGNSPLSINPALYVSNIPENYFRFDLSTFLTVPYSGAWTDEGSRQLFWNYFLKSALFGEFAFQSDEKMVLAKGVAALFLAMIVLAAFGARHIRRNIEEPAPIVLSFALLLFAAPLFRAAIPIASAADFRYSFAMLIPGCILYTQGAGLPRLAVGWSFVTYSIAHMLFG